MKKSTIWILTIVMACAFAGLVYVQIMYMEQMIKMRNEQFSETVRRSLFGVARNLEQAETLHFLEEEGSELATGLGPMLMGFPRQPGPTWLEDGSEVAGMPEFLKPDQSSDKQGSQSLSASEQYTYQKGLVNEVILNILSKSSKRPITERADSAAVSGYLHSELENQGLLLPFEFAIVSRSGKVVYSTSEFKSDGSNGSLYSQLLFPNDPLNKLHYLKVTFPTKSEYIFSSIRFMIPSFVLSFILLFIFIYTIILAFRQKKLSEMKNDFINNMTHEFKTPISTISLASQMLNDDTVRKSPKMLEHITTVIGDETKRLRFQVEKVLQMSMFDRQKATLKLEETDISSIILNVVHTYKIKVEKIGGKITTDLQAEDSIANLDEMHFTNVIFNLLDNAFKYRREEVPLELKISTRNINEETIEIVIADNGIGIKKEDLRKIFEKFYRVSTGNRHDVKGFGLGLAYVNKMIRELHGQIRVESELGVGSNFIITLPLIK